jgi:hypothetical protein
MKNLNQNNVNNANQVLNAFINQQEIKEFNLNNYLNQALREQVKFWINHNLKNYLKKHPENTNEIEHIIDYLNSDSAPERLHKMSYKQARDNADKWLKTQIKKGKTINEQEADLEVFMEFANGFKIVKLVGENAYKKEGFLMGHCVATYFGRTDSSIYSLRDNQNNPHATVELRYQNSDIYQVKGKGNGAIHPAYINYLLEFFAKVNLEIRGSELYNLGYKAIDKETYSLIQDIKGLKFLDNQGKKYLFMSSQMDV